MANSQSNAKPVETYGKTDDVIVLERMPDRVKVRLVKRDKPGNVIGQIDATFPRTLAGATALWGDDAERQLFALAFEAWKVKTRAKIGGKAKASKVASLF